MSKAAIEAGARACEKYLGNRADLAAPINHEDLSAAIVIAFLRALQAEGPSEEEVERVARKIYEAEKPNHHAEWEIFSRLEGNRKFMFSVARAAIAADRAWLIAEIEGK